MIRAIILFTGAAVLCAAQAPPAVHPLTAVCADEEIRDFGLVCDEDDPCPVFLEITGLEAVGPRLLVSGNFHTAEATLWSLLLMSDDSGKTWTEPSARQRGVSLDQIQFVTIEHGWISGQTAGSLARDPFLLRTVDGGKTWRRNALYRDSTVAFIERFRFSSPEQGTMIVQRRGAGAAGRYQRLETRDGGITWMVRESGDDPIEVKRERGPLVPEGWRIRADAKANTLRIEKREGAQWRTAAVFPLVAGRCAARPPEPVAEPQPPAGSG